MIFLSYLLHANPVRRGVANDKLNACGFIPSLIPFNLNCTDFQHSYLG